MNYPEHEKIKNNCPNKENHTHHPRGYLEFEAWAYEAAKTHTQKQCPSCGMWAIWEPRKKGAILPMIESRRLFGGRFSSDGKWIKF